MLRNIMLAIRTVVKGFVHHAGRSSCIASVKSGVLQKQSSNFKSLKFREVYSSATYTHYYVLVICVFSTVFYSILCK